MMQETFLMLKPDAFEQGHVEAILQDLKDHHLVIAQQADVVVDMDVMKTLLEHYQQVIDEMPKAFCFPGKLFNSFYYEGPHHIMPMKITYDGEEDIIAYTRALVGKTNPKEAQADTIRGKYSSDDYEQASQAWRLVNNVIHASDSKENAMRELAIWKLYLK